MKVAAIKFQTPSAGRWVLQRKTAEFVVRHETVFQTPSAGRWVLQHRHLPLVGEEGCQVSNPISGEVGAAATPSAVRLRKRDSFKPHQRGGGCCSEKQ